MNYEHMRPDMDADRDTRFWRLDTFSDTIFAVAMTLLVFTFPLAGLPQNLGPKAVQNLLQGLSGQFETFIISSSSLERSGWHTTGCLTRLSAMINASLAEFRLLAVYRFRPIPYRCCGQRQSSSFPSRFMHQTSLAQGSLTLVWVYASYNFRLISASTPIREVRLSTLQGLWSPASSFIDTRGFRKPRLAEYFWLLSSLAQWAVARQWKNGRPS